MLAAVALLSQHSPVNAVGGAPAAYDDSYFFAAGASLFFVPRSLGVARNDQGRRGYHPELHATAMDCWHRQARRQSGRHLFPDDHDGQPRLRAVGSTIRLPVQLGRYSAGSSAP